MIPKFIKSKEAQINFKAAPFSFYEFCVKMREVLISVNFYTNTAHIAQR